MKDLANWFREQATRLEVQAFVPEIKEHVKQLRCWATGIEQWIAELARTSEDKPQVLREEDPVEEKSVVDKFHRHELMDRASFVMEMLDTLSTHAAHTDSTRRAFEDALCAVHNLYQVAAAECFVDEDLEKEHE